jgi:hypothetical protein
MNTTPFGKNRVLALDVRPRYSGYAFFEGPRRLLDAGIARLKSREDVERRFSDLMKTYRPDILVLRKLPADTRRDHPVTRYILRTARRLARQASVPITQITEKQLREQMRDTHNKHEMADFLAQLFPQLAWRVPPARRLWQSERRRMAIFDAVAYGITYFGSAHYPETAKKGQLAI